MSLTHVLCAEMKAVVVQEKHKLFMYAGDRVSHLVMLWKLDLNDGSCHTACSSNNVFAGPLDPGNVCDGLCDLVLQANRISARHPASLVGSQEKVPPVAGDKTDVVNIRISHSSMKGSITAASKDSSIC